MNLEPQATMARRLGEVGERTPLSPSEYDHIVSFRSAPPAPLAITSVADMTIDVRHYRNESASMRRRSVPLSPSLPIALLANWEDGPLKRRIPRARVVNFCRHHPILTTIFIITCMAVLVVVVLLALSLTHVLGHALPPVTSSTRTILPTVPIQLGFLSNFPDPSLYYSNTTALWYVYGTNARAGILSLSPHIDNATLSNLQASTILSDAISHNLQLLTSPDLETWTVQPDPLSTLGAWVHPPPNASSPYNYFANGWAPDIFLNPTTQKYTMYYSATSAQYSHAHCIGAATADPPMGPFECEDDVLICPAAEGGAIDPAVFVDDVAYTRPSGPSPSTIAAGKSSAGPTTTEPFFAARTVSLSPLATSTRTLVRTSPALPVPATNSSPQKPVYLLYKVDGNSRGHGGSCGNTVLPLASTPIQLQLLSSSGLTPAPDAAPITLLDRSIADDDGPLIEAPSLVKVDGKYILFYSSGCTRDANYDVKYAVSSSGITGPYERKGVLLKTGDYGLVGPGSVSVRVTEPGTYYNGGTVTGVGALDDQMMGMGNPRSNIAAAAARNGGPGSGDTSAKGSNIGSSEDKWIMAFAARVGTRVGGVRAFFTVSLKFDDAGSVAVVEQ